MVTHADILSLKEEYKRIEKEGKEKEVVLSLLEKNKIKFFTSDDPDKKGFIEENIKYLEAIKGMNSLKPDGKTPSLLEDVFRNRYYVIFVLWEDSVPFVIVLE